ncbi:MAG: F420H2 dehydrogenase subunit FpoO [ANME-2 cluster archaeon]|nr:F420H2 dehydrogenase subunit FpoO [ANME-2 cluster archaeon]
MGDCDLCGVSRPTLCPVKPDVPRFRKAFPTGMWMGICEECTNATHKANSTRVEAKGKKCDLCSKKDEKLYSVGLKVPDFSEPYYKEKEVNLCETCLDATEITFKKQQAEKVTDKGHH